MMAAEFGLENLPPTVAKGAQEIEEFFEGTQEDYHIHEECDEHNDCGYDAEDDIAEAQEDYLMNTPDMHGDDADDDMEQYEDMEFDDDEPEDSVHCPAFLLY